MTRVWFSHALILPLLAWSLPQAVAQGFTPEEALKRMKVADGFEVSLVASEPLIRQPVTMTFDDRGRIWVIQYLQYPTPAGLKPVAVDQYLRTVYDKVPEPPPLGPKGADKITILEDTDGDGRMDKAKDFVTGLNLATGLCLGHGGVWVLQAPYLLFYPDRNGDDVPDSDPEVHLKGFGLEDAHALGNSLQWGPDGWLYGAQGSTVTAKIRGIEFQQGIWRYHPRTKEFELFSEGGGNTWGLDFDRHGNVIAGTNWGDKAMLHQVQGGYYIKGFGKHGPLHNPHTYGYFDHVPYTGFKGGHVTCGGVLYRGDTFPEQFRDQYIASNLLSNVVNWHILERKGSTFIARHGGEFLTANDTWFRAIDCLVGPDGAVYVADWYDKRANHVDPIDTWDRSNGRIYRIQASGGRKPPENVLSSGGLRPPLAGRSSQDLVTLLNHPNAWWVRECSASSRSDAIPKSSPGCGSRSRTRRASWLSTPCSRFTSRADSMKNSLLNCSVTPTRMSVPGPCACSETRRTCRRQSRRSLWSWPAPTRVPSSAASSHARPSGCRRRIACPSSANCSSTRRTWTICTSRCFCGGPSRTRRFWIANWS